MTDAVSLALVAAVAPTIASLAALFVGLNNSKKQDNIVKKSDTIIEKAVEIHTLTNSNLTNVTAALALANAKIEGLQKLIESMGAAKVSVDKVILGGVTKTE